MSSIITFFVYLAVFYYLGKQAAKNAPKAETFQASRSEDGAVIPVVHGTAWLGSMVVWYGNPSSKAIKERQMLQKVTTGYAYYSDIHLVLCLGKIDHLRKISIDGKTVVYDGFLSSGTVHINKPKLFGDQEGGVFGNISIGNGGFHTRLAAQGEFATKYKGVTSLVFHTKYFNEWASTFEKGNYHGFYFGNTPYLKQMNYLVQAIESVPCPVQLNPYKAIPIGEESSDKKIYKRIAIVIDDTYLLDEQARLAIKADIRNFFDWYRQQTGMVAVFRISIVSSVVYGGFNPNRISAHNFTLQYAPEELEIENVLDQIFGDSYNIRPTQLRSNPAYFFHPDQTSFFTRNFSFLGDDVENQMLIYSKGGYGITQEGFDLSDAKLLARNTFNLAKVSFVYADYLTSGFGSENYYRLLFNDQILPMDTSTDNQSIAISKLRASGDFAIFGLNPAVIIYDCLTNKDWGMGLSIYNIDVESFRRAAATLFTEGFGLCFAWGKEGRILDYVDEVRAHISAVLYEDMQTGLWVLKLNRQDYDIEALPVLNKSNIVSIDAFDRIAFADRISQITVKYNNLKANAVATTAAQNLALIMANEGNINSKTVDYNGIVDPALASRIALRDLRQASSSLASVSIKVPKNIAASLNQGDCFIFDHNRYAENRIVMRVVNIDLGSASSTTAILSCIQDVFGLPDAGMNSAETDFGTPREGRKDITAFKSVELSYYQASRLQSPPAKILGSVVGRPKGAPVINSIVYQTSGGSSTNFEAVGTVVFAPHFELESTLTKTATTINTMKFFDFNEEIKAPFIVSINNECIRVNSFNVAGSTLTMQISRGADDTTPKQHAVGSKGIVIDDFMFSDLTEFALGETVYTRATSRDSSEEGMISTAPEQKVIFGRRLEAPLPPINMTINGLSFPQEILGDVVLSYAIQADKSSGKILAWGDNAPVPASGVTISARAMIGTEVLKMINGVAENSINFSEIDLRDGNLTIELWSVKDGIESWQRVSHSFAYSKVNMRLDITLYNRRSISGITNENSDVSVTIDEALSANFTAESLGQNSVIGKAPAFAAITIEIDEGE